MVKQCYSCVLSLLSFDQLIAKNLRRRLNEIFMQKSERRKIVICTDLKIKNPENKCFQGFNFK